MAGVTPRRGDVFWVILDSTVGTKIKKTSPAVIVSNDSCNAHGARVVVVPVTSNVASLHPGEAKVVVTGREARVLGDQLRSIDKQRLGKRIARLTNHELEAIDEALRITLAL